MSQFVNLLGQIMLTLRSFVKVDTEIILFVPLNLV